MVDDTIVDRGCETRWFDLEERAEKARTGPPKTPFFPFLPTVRPDEFGPARIVRYVSSMDIDLPAHIQLVSEKLNLPQHVAWRAVLLANKVRKAMKPRSLRYLSPACVFIAAREHGFPILLRDLKKIVGEDLRAVARMIREISREFNINIDIDENSLIRRISETAGLSFEEEELLRKLYEEVKKAKLTSGRSPYMVLVSLALVAKASSGRVVKQRDIADLFGVTEVSIRHNLRKFEPVLKKYGLDLESLKRKGLILARNNRKRR